MGTKGRHVLTAWLRLSCAFFVLFALSCLLWVLSRRSPYAGIDVGAAIWDNLLVVLSGPVFPLFIAGKPVGIATSAIFWIALVTTACRSRLARPRRWFYLFLAASFAMTLVWMYAIYTAGAGFVMAL